VRCRAWCGTGGPWLVRVGVPLATLALVARGCAEQVGPARALRVGSGARAVAVVEARRDAGPWQRCGYAAVTGEYVCEGLATVYDATANILNDAPPSWGFITPAVIVRAQAAGVEVRVSRRLRLEGTYWASAGRDEALLSLDGGPPEEVRTHHVVRVLDGTHLVQLTAAVPTTGKLKLAFVARDSLVPRRPKVVPGASAASPR